MAQTIKFTKMHGAGNDYIYVNTLLYSIPDPSTSAIKWSAYHTGIGSDGLVLIGYSDNIDADYSMRIFNADGSEAMMCGNASRCIGKYLYEKGITDKTLIRLKTLSGIKILRLTVIEGKVESVTVDMSEPILNMPQQCTLCNNEKTEDIITLDEKSFKGTFVSMGNPHFVIFTDNISSIDIEKYGPLLEHHKVFPSRCNIEFAQVTDKDTIRTRVWERGSGITMACGTGACATSVAAAITGRTSRKNTIIMDGGNLSIEWDKTDNHVYMSGPAEFVFDGEIEL